MTNQLETAKEWIADLNKIIDKTDNECTKEKRDVLEWLVESVEELEKELDTTAFIARQNDAFGINKMMEVERYKQALEQITQLGWSDDFGGGHNYMGEYHAQAIKISEKALEREG